jgi:hypothetical protein
VAPVAADRESGHLAIYCFMAELPAHLQTALDRELDDGEQVRWQAQPSGRVLVREALESILGILIMFNAFSVGMILLSILDYRYDIFEGDDSPVILFVFAGVIVAFTIMGCVIGWVALNQEAATTVYTITDKRVIILRRTKRGITTERDYRADELIHLARKEYRDGFGTLTLESARGSSTTARGNSRHRLQAIEQVIEIERLLRKQFGES